MTEDDRKKKRFDVAVQIRNFEINLFWKRSLFFWGFIASAFVGYAALSKYQSDLSVIVACFGMVCSFAWTLVNRGSKYWQESWETKVEKYEAVLIGALFAEEEAVQSHKGFWLGARKYSVSKLATALSDYVFVLWFIIVVKDFINRYLIICKYAYLEEIGITSFVVFSFSYLLLLLWCGRKTSRPKKTELSSKWNVSNRNRP